MPSNPKILVVDDTKTNVEVLEGILSPSYDIYVALNGVKALDLVHKVKPDLVLLDVMMPGMDGYETFRRIKAMPESEDLPVIFLTAKSDTQSEKDGLSLGAVDYIVKPFTSELVVFRVQNQLKFKHHRDVLDAQVKAKTNSLRQTLKVMLTSLATLAEYRDNETGAHIRRTQMIVHRLAEVLLNNPKFRNTLFSIDVVSAFAIAAPLHDIGKVGIQDSVLRKPGLLTDDERKLMQMHTTLGYDVLMSAIKDLEKDDNMGEGRQMIQIAANIALSHHEHYDGSGYPKGLSGENIPVCARLMAVADVYDALVSPRIYKKAWSHQEAIEEIKRESGLHFDPDVVKTFLSFADELPAMYRAFERAEVNSGGKTL